MPTMSIYLLHSLCLSVTCPPGEPLRHTCCSPRLYVSLLTALSSPSLWVQSFSRSVSFDLTPLSVVKTALSKQTCHRDWE